MTMNDSTTDGVWRDRCVKRLVELDPWLKPELAQPIADDLCERSRWRAMAPEDAAQRVFDVGNRRGNAPGNSMHLRPGDGQPG